MSSESYVDLLVQMQVLHERPIRAAIQALQPPRGSRGLDAGCGIGLQAVLLTRAAGPSGHVIGLDNCHEHLLQASRIVKQAGLSARFASEEADVRRLPFRDGCFDWVWSADCVGYGPPLDPPHTIKELARVVKPGGTVAILAWSSQTLLPGYPALEAHLSAASSGIAPFSAGERPEAHFLRALGSFRDAGLEDLSVYTFCGDLHAPLTAEVRRAVTLLLGMRWSGVEPELSPEDLAEYQRLCLPESPDFVVDHPDYYAFFTYSMFRGRTAGS